MTKIAVLGGGNGAHAAAADLSLRGFEVIMYEDERFALLDAMGYSSDIAAHGIGGAVETDSIKEAIAGDPNFAKITGPANLQNRYYSEDIPYGIDDMGLDALRAHLVEG